MVAVMRQITTALGVLGAVFLFIARAKIPPPGDTQAVVIVLFIYLLVYGVVDFLDALCFPTNWDRMCVLVAAPLALLLLGVWCWAFWAGQGMVPWPGWPSVATVKGICIVAWLLYTLYDLCEALYWVVSRQVQHYPGVEWVIVTAIVAIIVVVVLIFLA